MSIDKTWQINSTSSEQTELLAEKLGKACKGSEVIELVSDLGGGKTTFVRGLARGIGSQDRVASPTFTISRVYQAKDKQLHHFDFYRLNEAGIVAAELAEVVDDPQNITVVEWGDIVQDVLPGKRLTIEITRTGEDTRTISINYPESLEYLVMAMQQ